MRSCSISVYSAAPHGLGWLSSTQMFMSPPEMSSYVHEVCAELIVGLGFSVLDTASEVIVRWVNVSQSDPASVVMRVLIVAGTPGSVDVIVTGASWAPCESPP